MESAIQKHETANLSKARAEALKVAKEFGIPLEALIQADSTSRSKQSKNTQSRKTKRNVRKVPPKYQHPDDPSLTWTGRGLKPKWVVSLLERGVSLNDLLIQNPH